MDKLETRIKAILVTAKGTINNTTLAEHMEKGTRHIYRLLHPDVLCSLISYIEALNALGYELGVNAHIRKTRVSQVVAEIVG